MKLYHSFKQGWREGSITSENTRLTRNTHQRPHEACPRPDVEHADVTSRPDQPDHLVHHQLLVVPASLQILQDKGFSHRQGGVRT